jgi:tetratricopeptide (TPR) repeat protein
MTATCFKQKSLLEMEKDWDAVVKSFRLSTHVQVDIYDTFTLKEGEKDEWHEARSIAGGPLYAEAYKAMESGQFFKARSLLEICLSEDNSNVLAHKELAVILKRQGDLSGALFQRQEVKRLSPLDMVNRHNLVGLFVALERKDEALIEANEIIEQFPVDPHFHKRLAEILNIHLPYPTDGTPISPDAMDRVYKAYIHFETGHKFFRTGKYEEALEQFEKGKRQSTELSGNFLGVSTTIMQMIEFNAVAEDQISTNLDRAEENINECIRISPTESDYLNLKNEIDKYRKKYQQ